jgi:hypothetical protein
MATYDYREPPGESPGYEWADRKGNILKVADALWDTALDNDKSRIKNDIECYVV